MSGSAATPNDWEVQSDNYGRLVRELETIRRAVRQAERDNAPGSKLLELLSRESIAREAVEIHQKRSG